MSNFSEAITRAIGLLQGFTSQKAEDGEITDTELDQLQGELEAVIAAIEYERELRDSGRQAAACQGREARTEI